MPPASLYAKTGRQVAPPAREVPSALFEAVGTPDREGPPTMCRGAFGAGRVCRSRRAARPRPADEQSLFTTAHTTEKGRNAERPGQTAGALVLITKRVGPPEDAGSLR